MFNTENFCFAWQLSKTIQMIWYHFCSDSFSFKKMLFSRFDSAIEKVSESKTVDNANAYFNKFVSLMPTQSLCHSQSEEANEINKKPTNTQIVHCVHVWTFVHLAFSAVETSNERKNRAENEKKKMHERAFEYEQLVGLSERRIL